MPKSLFLALFLYDKKYQTKLKTSGKILISKLLQEYQNSTIGNLSFEEFLRGSKLLESNDVKDQIKLLFRLINNMNNRDKLKKKEIEKFLRTLHKTGTLPEIMSSESEDEIPIQDFSFDQNGFINEDEVIEEMFKNDSFAKFISCFISEHQKKPLTIVSSNFSEIVGKIMRLKLWSKRALNSSINNHESALIEHSS